MQKSFLNASFFAVAVLCMSPGHAFSANPDIDQAIENWVEKHPDKIIQVLNNFAMKQKEARAKQQEEQILSMASELVTFDSYTPILGNPNGKKLIVEFIDANCTYCRRSSPEIEEIINSNSDVKVVQRFVSILAPSSLEAQIMAMAVWKNFPDKYAKFSHDMMEQQGVLSSESLDSLLNSSLGSDASLKVKTDIQSSRDIYRKASEDSLSLFRRSQIEGTPFFFIPSAGSSGVIRGFVPKSQLEAVLKK